MSKERRSLEDVVLTREDVLRAVVLEPRDKRELTEAVESSRSTVDRAIRELRDAGLVKRVDGRYEATVAGGCSLDAAEQFHERIRDVGDAVAVLNQLPVDGPLDRRFLADADAYAATPEMPDGVVQQLFDSVRTAKRLRGIAPVVLSGHFEGFYEAATAGDTQVEMLISDSVVSQLVSTAATRAVFLEQLRDENVTISRAEIPFSFGLWVTEWEAGILVYTDTGVGGLLRNDSDEAVAWAESVFADLAADADRITPDGIRSVGDD
ncbi:helix-turn-helix transcriptional regulator [Halogeometricum limi]|uniref:Predicted transcriptional regulator, contains HTH domain n=1 Tax=Halogeometricum limi TaxID=555875 RepID=A0A1I6HL74_9EURY|nr:ArsR family transcriptional regulator [Halogeometricum limi]SFR55195.1 Predicted transcriptional regulator, contains HTH domain [Halogeometricum limi]